MSNVCGCAGFIQKVTKGEDARNVIIADYVSLEDNERYDLEDLLQINRELRDQIEHKASELVALEICARLPKTDSETLELIRMGHDLAKHMSWDSVVKNCVLKSLGEKKAAQEKYRVA